MNKVILMGRLTKDPELRYTSANNIPVASFTLAVNRRFQKKGEERQADFISCTAWNKTAEFCKNYYKKGQQVAITGRIQTRTWDDEQGKRHYATDVIVDEAYFADSKREGSQNTTFQNDPPSQVPKQNDFVTIEDDDDDLPF
ncbi:MAG: single-stranded DNA-binding protein [Clostridiales bacterium]|nr:single-stranded DNA-binding protein [Clostridiales bacterium]